MPVKLFKFPKILKPQGKGAEGPTAVKKGGKGESLASRCTKALLKPTRKRIYSDNTLKTAQCLSDKSLLILPLEEPTHSTITTQQEEDALAVLQRNQVVALPTLGLVTAASPIVPSRPTHPHRRCLSLTQMDFDDLIYESRGWRYDPSTRSSFGQAGDLADDVAAAAAIVAEVEALPPRRPARMNRHDRERNLALCDYDFERYIFKPQGPRLASFSRTESD